MTVDEQYDWIDERELHRDAHSEMKLREVAASIVDHQHSSIENVARVPVRGALVAYSGNPPRMHRYHEVRVDMTPLLGLDRDIALLLVEKLIRPQLERAGWVLLP